MVGTKIDTIEVLLVVGTGWCSLTISWLPTEDVRSTELAEEAPPVGSWLQLGAPHLGPSKILWLLPLPDSSSLLGAGEKKRFCGEFPYSFWFDG